MEDLTAFFEKYIESSVWNVGVMINRTNGIPLDKTSLFRSMSDAEAYAAGEEVSAWNADHTKALVYYGSTAYPGQSIAVVGETSVSCYTIGPDRGLIRTNDIQNVWVKNPDVVELSDGAKSDLSVIKLPKAEYDAIVADSPGALRGNCLYVVDSDYVDAYGQQISNVAMGEDFTHASSYVGVAATRPFVEAVSADVCGRFGAAFADLANAISSNAAISGFRDTVGSENGTDKVDLDSTVSALYSLVSILIGNV